MTTQLADWGAWMKTLAQSVRLYWSDERIALPARVGLAFIAGTVFALAAWEPPVPPDDRADAARPMDATGSVLSAADLHPSRLITAEATHVRRKLFAADVGQVVDFSDAPHAKTGMIDQAMTVRVDDAAIDHPHSRGPPRVSRGKR